MKEILEKQGVSQRKTRAFTRLEEPSGSSVLLADLPEGRSKVRALEGKLSKEQKKGVRSYREDFGDQDSIDAEAIMEQEASLSLKSKMEKGHLISLRPRIMEQVNEVTGLKTQVK